MSIQAELNSRDIKKITKLEKLKKDYTEKLEKIGESLGFDTRKPKTELLEAIGCIGCMWKSKNAKIKELDGLPTAMFEIICYEEDMILRQQCAHMLIVKPTLTVFVLLEERIVTGNGIMSLTPHRKRSKKTIQEQWLEAISEFHIGIFGKFTTSFLRIAVWTDKEVDKLYSKILSKQSVVK